MENRTRLKRPKCIEWIIQTPPSHDFTIESSCFKLQKRKCNLELRGGYGHGMSCLYLKVDGKLHSPISVTVHVASIVRSFPLETRPVQSECQIVWRYTGSRLAGRLLTIEVHANYSVKGEYLTL